MRERLQPASEQDRGELVAFSKIEQWLLQVAHWWDLRRWPSLLLIALCFLPLAVVEARNNLLSNDEIYTVHIAQQPSLAQMVGLAREIDLHPPVHYLAVREAMRLPGPRWFTARLPSLASGLALCFALFAYIARRMGYLSAAAAVCIMWCTPAVEYAWSDRPYALWLAVLWLLLLALDWRERNKGWVSAFTVLILSTVLVMTHLLGCLCLVILAVARLRRGTWDRGLDLIAATLLGLPCLLAIWFHYQLHALAQNAFPPQQLASVALLRLTYYLILNNVVVVVCACVAIAASLCLRNSLARVSQLETSQGIAGTLSSRDRVTMIALASFPVLLFLPASLLHLQFWTRYGAVSMPAFGVLVAWSISGRIHLVRIASFLTVCAGVAFMANRLISENHPQTNVETRVDGRSPVALASLESDLPIVVESPMTYVEMADREPHTIARRVFYLTDPEAALKLSQYTLFENEDKITRLLNLPATSEPLAVFLKTHQRFYVVGEMDRPEVWLLRKLRDDGYQIDYRGHFVSSYETSDLYFVRSAKAAITH